MQILRNLTVVSVMAVLSASVSFGEVLEHPRNLKEEARVYEKAQKRWMWSTAALVAASFVDAHSSMGKMEANGLLRSADGRFGARGMGIKMGMVGGILFSQYMIVKKNPGLAGTLGWANFGMAGVKLGVAARNYGIDKPTPTVPQYLLR
jgi:hypothetical protein